MRGAKVNCWGGVRSSKTVCPKGGALTPSPHPPPQDLHPVKRAVCPGERAWSLFSPRSCTDVSRCLPPPQRSRELFPTKTPHRTRQRLVTMEGGAGTLRKRQLQSPGWTEPACIWAGPGGEHLPHFKPWGRSGQEQPAAGGRAGAWGKALPRHRGAGRGESWEGSRALRQGPPAPGPTVGHCLLEELAVCGK